MYQRCINEKTCKDFKEDYHEFFNTIWLQYISTSKGYNTNKHNNNFPNNVLQHIWIITVNNNQNNNILGVMKYAR